MLRAARGAAPVRGGGRRDRNPLQVARGSGAGADRERARGRGGAGVRLRADRAARPRAGDGLAPPEEAHPVRPPRPRGAREVGLLLRQPRRDGASRVPRRPDRRRLLLMSTTTTDEVREEVRRRYAESALAVIEQRSGCGCGCSEGPCCEPESADFGESLYDGEQRAELPDEAALASLGCGNPTAVAELRKGETVLDLGSGGGIDVILSARRVGPTGRAYGLDMTDEMLALAQQNAAEAGIG